MTTPTPDPERERVLARVRRALGRPAAGGDAPGATAAADRVTRPRPNTIPMRAQLQQPQLGELFEEMVRAAQATIVRVPSPAAVPGALAAWCAERGQPATAVLAPASDLADLDWSAAGVAVERRLVRSGDPVGVSTAAAGIAETGTLAVLSGPANPVTGNFLPEAHVVVLDAAAVVGTPEDSWAMLRELGAGDAVPLPRTVNWITGPSRTGDIEMTMQMGAHGPVRLHVILVDGAP
ncbi:MAG TPA: lactate utilization protein [Pseudomonadales bacterium]|nr:lactate utilization protein [Pseudomonadales bacterium]